MSRAIVPAEINSKYVPFLYKHFSGVEAHYGNKKVKGVKLLNSSSLGKFIRVNAVSADHPIDSPNITIYFSLSEHKVKSNLYKQVNGQFTFLKLPEELTKDLNRLVRDLFLLTYLSFVDGYLMANSSKGSVDKGIKIFMEHYQLDEFNSLTFSNLHQIYYRKRNLPRLNSFQKSLKTRK